jgi:uncharacterized protein YjiS (DUF1127 family)
MSWWSVFEWLWERLAALCARSRQHHRARRVRTLLNELSETQCKDAGIDRFAVRPRKPSIEIAAGLMARLMQMR